MFAKDGNWEAENAEVHTAASSACYMHVLDPPHGCSLFQLLNISEDEIFPGRHRICKEVWPPSSASLFANLSLATEGVP